MIVTSVQCYRLVVRRKVYAWNINIILITNTTGHFVSACIFSIATLSTLLSWISVECDMFWPYFYCPSDELIYLIVTPYFNPQSLKKNSFTRTVDVISLPPYCSVSRQMMVYTSLTLLKVDWISTVYCVISNIFFLWLWPLNRGNRHAWDCQIYTQNQVTS